ncbi:hypothetical protein [Cylindrospermopsis raciborskii]|uniref:hypothetical protein n=1 Tax=Cylindrospermopsis raciborskii TaxID=77022 RepID=UPI003A8D9B02
MFFFKLRTATANILVISSIIAPFSAQAEPVGVVQEVQNGAGNLSSLDNQTVDPAILRQQLRVKPIRINTQRVYSPGTSAGIPSGFGTNWGDLYFAIAGATANRVRREIDGGASVALGFGNARDILGLELSYSLLSIRKFGRNGSFNAKVHRIVYSNPNTYIATAIGWNNFARHGENDRDAGIINGQFVGTPSSVYGVVSAYHFLNPKSANPVPVNISLGVGEAPLFSNSGLGIIAGAGIQVTPNIGVSTGWSGKGLNLGVSYLPVRTLPMSLNVIYGDVFQNTEPGSVLSFSLGYGFDFTP